MVVRRIKPLYTYGNYVKIGRGAGATSICLPVPVIVSNIIGVLPGRVSECEAPPHRCRELWKSATDCAISAAFSPIAGRDREQGNGRFPLSMAGSCPTTSCRLMDCEQEAGYWRCAMVAEQPYSLFLRGISGNACRKGIKCSNLNKCSKYQHQTSLR